VGLFMETSVLQAYSSMGSQGRLTMARQTHIIVTILWFDTHRQQPAIWQHISYSMLIGGDDGC
jgi:lipoprotein signal peptidase